MFESLSPLRDFVAAGDADNADIVITIIVVTTLADNADIFITIILVTSLADNADNAITVTLVGVAAIINLTDGIVRFGVLLGSCEDTCSDFIIRLWR